MQKLLAMGLSLLSMGLAVLTGWRLGGQPGAWIVALFCVTIWLGGFMTAYCMADEMIQRVVQRSRRS